MRRRRVYSWTGLALIVLALWWSVRSMLLPLGGSGTLIVPIPRGSSAGDIGRILAAHKVIRSSLGFTLMARATGRSKGLKPGAYLLSPSMAPLEVMAKIANGEVCARWVTFPEGFTVRQMAERLAAEGFGNADRFLHLGLYGGSSLTSSFHRPKSSLEGYLFPDTYLIPLGGSEEALIQEMLDCFDRKVVETLAADMAKSDMSLHKIVTLASLIEREARTPKDRALISAVLRSRLRRGMRLECDATVLYALGRHKNRVFYKDLGVDSPYNTYRYPGLPPGPIANPGLACIEAALHPAQADYLYYVARPDGSHIFSHSMAEHERAKQAARREAAGRVE